MKRAVITVVGGGAFIPRLCDALARSVNLPEVELQLSARRENRLRVIADHSARRLSAARPAWTVQAAPTLERALEGASIVVLLVRVGGLEARAWDETFPRRFGLAGDEGLGPGGIANAWRTLPELARIGRILLQVAPQARVLNLMAPLGVTTRLLREQGLDAVGLCELPLITLEAWLANARESAAGATWRYGGFNHLGWFWGVTARGRDILRRLADAPRSSGPLVPIDRLTLERYGAAPLRYYYEIFDRDACRRHGLERSPDRARELMALSETMVQQFSEKPGLEIPAPEVRPTPWLDRAVAPIVSALLNGAPHAGFANLTNGKNIPELPPELVVELGATFTSQGGCPITPGPLPAQVAQFLGHIADAEALTFRAAEQRDPALLAEAIRALPLPIPEAIVQELASLAQRDVGTREQS